MKKFVKNLCLLLVCGVTALSFGACDQKAAPLLEEPEKTPTETAPIDSTPTEPETPIENPPHPILPDPDLTEEDPPAPDEDPEVSENPPVHQHTACPTCGKCTATDCPGTADEKCAGHNQIVPEPAPEPDPEPDPEPEPEPEPEPLPALSTLVTDVTTNYNGLNQISLVTAQSWFDEQTMTVTPTNITNAGTHTVTITRTTDQTTATITLTINQINVTITIDNQTSQAGNALVDLTATVTSGTLIGQDTWDTICTLSTTANINADGTYPITGKTTNDNYYITFINGTYTITPAPVVVIENPLTKIGESSCWQSGNLILVMTPTSATAGSYYVKNDPTGMRGTYKIKNNKVTLTDGGNTQLLDYESCAFKYEIDGNTHRLIAQATFYIYTNCTFVFTEFDA